ncbi:hypothetical protein BS78_01G440500 [Paspalum vaginatum]|nr:hypothetical protein BS78_01G440500 [Paspalum vaginatum]
MEVDARAPEACARAREGEATPARWHVAGHSGAWSLAAQGCGLGWPHGRCDDGRATVVGRVVAARPRGAERAEVGGGGPGEGGTETGGGKGAEDVATHRGQGTRESGDAGGERGPRARIAWGRGGGAGASRKRGREGAGARSAVDAALTLNR